MADKTILNQPWIQSYTEEEKTYNEKNEPVGVKNVIKGKSLVQETIKFVSSGKEITNYSDVVVLVDDIYKLLSDDTNCRPESDNTDPLVGKEGETKYYKVSKNGKYFYWECEVTDMNDDAAGTIKIKIECPHPTPEDFILLLSGNSKLSKEIKTEQNFYEFISTIYSDLYSTEPENETYLHYWLKYYYDTLVSSETVYNIQRTKMNVPEILHIDYSKDSDGNLSGEVKTIPSASYNIAQDDFLSNLLSMF
jgi:hypothetical protein